MIVRCIRNTNYDIEFLIYVECTFFRVLRITGTSSTQDCLVEDNIIDIDCTYSTPNGSTVMIICASKILICKISYDGIPGNCKEVLYSNYSGKWNSVLWTARAGIFLLCNDDGFYTASEDDSTCGITIAKQKMSVISEIGPQSKYFAHKDRFTVFALWPCTSQSNILIVSANPATGVKMVSWATPNYAANSMTLLWSLSMGTSHIVNAAQAYYEHGENALQWTVVYCNSVLWLLGPAGVLAKVSLQKHPTVTGLIILSEEQKRGGSISVALLLSCVSGIFLHVLVELSASACRVLEIRPVALRTVGWDQEVGGSAVLLPCCQELHAVPTESWVRHGALSSATGPVPLVLLGHHDGFGTQLLIEDALSESTEEWLAHPTLRRLVTATNSLAGMKDATVLSAGLEGGSCEGASLLALHTHAQSGQSAIFKLQTESYYARCSRSTQIELDGGDDLYVVAAAVTKVGTLLALSSRVTLQTAIYHCSSSSTTVKAEQLQLALYSGVYVQEEYTLALFSVDEFTTVQITSAAVHLLCLDKPTQSATSLQLLAAEKSVGGGVRRSCYGSDGTECSPRASSSGAPISQAEQIGVGLFAVRVGGEVLIVSVAAADSGRDCTMRVTQILQFASEACGVSSSSGITPATHDGALLVVCCWDGSLALFRNSSSCDHTLDLTQVVQNPAAVPDECSETPIRHLCVVHIYQSAEIAVHALICVSADDKVAVQHALYNVQQRTTQLSIAHCLSMFGGVESLTKLDVKNSGADGAAVCVLVRGLRTDCLLGCDMTLLDGCVRQVPILEWHSRRLVTPAGRRRPVLYFSMPRDGDSEGSAPQSPEELQIGWVESSKTLNENDIFQAKMCVGSIDLSEGPVTNVADRAFVPGLVVSMQLTKDHLRIIVLLENTFMPSAPGAAERVGGNPVVRAGRVVVYDAASFEILWQQDISSSAHKAGLGYLVAALPGPVPVSPPSASMMLSLVHCMPSVRHLPTASVAIASKLTFTTFSLQRRSAGSDERVYDAVPAGSVVLAAESCDSGATSRSGPPQPEAEHTCDPLPSAAFHVHALSEDLLVVCMHDNVLRLVGWKGHRDSLSLAELSRTSLENKSAVVVKVQGVLARRVVVSLALCGLEIHSLQRGGAGTTASAALQFTHFISQEAAIWTSVAAKEHRHANEDAELSITLTDRLTSRHQAAVLEIPSCASALTGAVLRCSLDALTLPEGIQSRDIVQFLPALPSSGIGSKLLRRNGQVVPYSTAGLSSAR